MDAVELKALPLAAAALLVYVLLSALFIWHGASLTHELSGIGSDPFDSTWFLAWWPYALTHHIDPFFTRLIWYPIGVSLLWVTSVPLLSLLGWPVTAAFGPVVTYNLLIVTAPVLSAWSAYFLCRHVARDFTAALIGGFLFGFSTYETSQSIGALNLTIIFCVPLLLLVVLKRLDDELSRPAVVALAASLLLAQFLICIEVFATVFVFGGIAWILALLYLPDRRPALLRLFADALWATPFVALPLAPLLVSMARHYALINHPAAWPYVFTVDPFSLVIPSGLNIFGAPFAPVAKHFASVPQEQDAYLGLPLILVLALFARAEGRQGRGRFLVACLLVCVILSFGPRLWVYGHFTAVVLPWALLMHLPLLGSALTGRFALFTSLAAALIVAIWLARPARHGWHLVLALLACAVLLPMPHPWRVVPFTSFFAPGRVEAVLGQNPRLLLLPYSRHGASSLWQSQNEFGFTQVGGYLGFPPAAAQSRKAVMELFSGQYDPGFTSDFAAYAQQAGAQYIVAGPGTDAKLMGHLVALDWPSRQVDGITIFTVPTAP
jgi:hypothetical protein